MAVARVTVTESLSCAVAGWRISRVNGSLAFSAASTCVVVAAALDGSTETDEQVWLTRVVNQVAQNEAEQLARLIQETAEALSQALELAAQATSAGKRIEQFSLDGFVKELPVPDFSGCPINLPRPRLLSISIAVVRHSVVRRIESDCGAFLERFFNS